MTISVPLWTSFSTLEANLSQIDIEVLENIGRDAAPFLDEPQQHVLGADAFLIRAPGLLVGQLHHFPGPVRKSFVHRHAPRRSFGEKCGGELFREVDKDNYLDVHNDEEEKTAGLWHV